GEILAPEEPAARPLVDVATERTEVADQRRGDAQRSLVQQGECLLHVRGLGHFGQRRGRANVQTIGTHLDATELFDGRQVDDLGGDGHALPRNPVLHYAGNQVAAATERFAGGAKLVQHADGLVDRRRLV